jgi:1-acyl-sn-glycerol-3-phosphate acyltransferase
LLRSISTLFCVVSGTLVLGPIAIVIFPFESRGRALKRLQCWWGRWILWGAGVRVEAVLGMEHIDPAAPQLFASNHQSLLDIPVLFAHLPVPIVMAAKKELFRIPLIGWMMQAARFPRIDRSNPEAAKAALQRSAERLKGTAVSVVLFPEGTRTRDGEVATFKKGAFFVARDLGVPILPLSLYGTRAALLKGSARVRAGVVRLKIGAPRQVVEQDLAHRDQVMAELREEVVLGLEELEALDRASRSFRTGDTSDLAGG